jgi:hypothetical protein
MPERLPGKIGHTDSTNATKILTMKAKGITGKPRQKSDVLPGRRAKLFFDPKHQFPESGRRVMTRPAGMDAPIQYDYVD